MKILEHYSLKHLNTFHVGANARYYTEIGTLDDLSALRLSGYLQTKPFLILGGGSNLLFAKDYEGLVVRMALRGIETNESAPGLVKITACAGENWDNLVVYCVENGFAGIENLSMIPGTVGAAPVQNIGAYGIELNEVFVEAEVFNTGTGEFRTYSNPECGFAYRKSIFKDRSRGHLIITSVTLQVSKEHFFRTDYGAVGEELDRMGVKKITLPLMRQAICNIRSRKLPDPAVLGNAGSFFKNPAVDTMTYNRIKENHPGLVAYAQQDGSFKLAAGWLIDQCGWKGARIGEAGVHGQQALVLVNHGNATGKEILGLAERIKESVWAKYGVLLEPEVNIID
jgi:UDP-N-acetylmuramate dehydrogenase